MAPDIWFSFLRNGDNAELLSICGHNVKDIIGLASLFLVIGEISSDPVASKRKFRFDEQALASSYTNLALSNPELPDNLRQAFETRRVRLEKKLSIK